MDVTPRPVTFTRMQDGSPEEFATVKAAERAQKKLLPGRIIQALEAVADEGVGGYQVNRTEHVLQSATRALRNGELAAAVIQPFVSPRITWILKVHPVFSMYYYAHFIGGDRNARERYRDHQWFDDAVYFCENYDENCFDPDYSWLPMDHFAPMLHEVFGREPVFD